MLYVLEFTSGANKVGKLADSNWGFTLRSVFFGPKWNPSFSLLQPLTLTGGDPMMAPAIHPNKKRRNRRRGSVGKVGWEQEVLFFNRRRQKNE